MDLSVITTYRCDSRCSMCYIWKVTAWRWVAWNKLKVSLGGSIEFDRCIDYGDVRSDRDVPHRRSYLEKADKKVLQLAESRRYRQLSGYFKR